MRRVVFFSELLFVVELKTWSGEPLMETEAVISYMDPGYKLNKKAHEDFESSQVITAGYSGLFFLSNTVI